MRNMETEVASPISLLLVLVLLVEGHRHRGPDARDPRRRPPPAACARSTVDRGADAWAPLPVDPVRAPAPSADAINRIFN